jgi:hypothetical protein
MDDDRATILQAASPCILRRPHHDVTPITLWEGAMDLKSIRDHLALARRALGPEHPLSARLQTVERQLTPGDALWGGDAVRVQADLLAISTELEQLPKVMPSRPNPAAQTPAPPEVPPGVDEAIKQVGDAIELL